MEADSSSWRIFVSTSPGKRAFFMPCVGLLLRTLGGGLLCGELRADVRVVVGEFWQEGGGEPLIRLAVDGVSKAEIEISRSRAREDRWFGSSMRPTVRCWTSFSSFSTPRIIDCGRCNPPAEAGGEAPTFMFMFMFMASVFPARALRGLTSATPAWPRRVLGVGELCASFLKLMLLRKSRLDLGELWISSDRTFTSRCSEASTSLIWMAALLEGNSIGGCSWIDAELMKPPTRCAEE